MKNVFLSLALLCVMFVGLQCVKGSTCSPRTTGSEATIMQSFATSNGITASVHASGLYYQVIDPGSGPSASTNSIIYITYTGTLLDGTVFDQQTDASKTGWPLSQLIEGWRIGIPLIQKGGHIQLIVPSSMAYGCQGYGSIPGNSVLYFDITLVNIL